MCIVVDTNSLANVFNESSAKHKMFKPIADWIFNGKGKIVYGGTKYIGEIGDKYLRLFNLLRDAQKAILCDEDEIDKESERVSQLIKHSNFDDQHIVGLLVVSGCKLICSEDKRAHPYFTNRLFFRKHIPKIYSGNKKHKRLLTVTNVAPICGDCVTLSKTQSKYLLKFLN